MSAKTKGHRIRNDYSIGVLFVMVSAVTFSTAGLFTKGVSAAAWEIIVWRSVFAATFTTWWTIHNGNFTDNFFRMGWSGIAVAIVGALGTAAFIAAFKLTTVANVSVIYAISPLLAALMAWLWIGEKPSQKLLIGCIGALIGVMIIAYGSLGKISLKGDALALWMAVAMALLMVIYRKYPNTPGAGPSVLSSLLLLPPALFLGDPMSVPVPEIMILVVFGLIFAIASVTLAEGAKRLPSGQTALLSTLETPIAPVLAFLVLSEIPGIATMIGGALIFVAILFTAREKNE